MQTAKAITTLREKLRMTQHQLADSLGITITSVSRYENGREPSRNVLAKLGELAANVGAQDLREAFTSKWKSGIAKRLEHLPSAGAQRRVQLADLKRWQAMPVFASEQLLSAKAVCIDMMSRVSEQDRQRLGGVNRLLSAITENVLMDLSRQIEVYVSAHEKEKK